MVDPADLVGTPFAYGGRDAQALDCYGLLMHLYKENHGVELPDFRSTEDMGTVAAKIATGLPVWEPCARTDKGACVLIRVGRFVSHCGYMLDENRMIHTWEKSGGVVIERLDAWKTRIVGFYRYVGKPGHA